MTPITPAVSTAELSSFSDYLGLYRKLQKQGLSGGAQIKVALLASFTVNGLRESLYLKCAEAGLLADTYVGGYNQIAQEILDPKSGLYACGAETVIIFLDVQTLTGDLLFMPYGPTALDRRAWVEGKLAELLSWVEAVKTQSQARVILHNFEVPAWSPLGILESKLDFGFIESISALNAGLRDAFKTDPRVFLFDYEAFCARIGKDRLRDPKMYYLGDLKLALEHLPALASAYVAYLRPMAGLTRKCLVLDLDNTLWGGILGEDGENGLRIGPTPEGRPYQEFQKMILALSQKGVILAVNSKNNTEEALKAMAGHPSMVLRPEHFAAARINWADKAENLREIASELDIGLDSLVFIDDDKANRERVRQALPEVLVVELPEDPALFCKTLAGLDAFDTLQLTEEDRGKARMYAEQKQRRTLAASAASLDDYLKGLGMVLTIRPADASNTSRIAQLTQKTNQFNMTTRRYDEESIRRFAGSERHLVFSTKVEDRFGDNGICGAAIVEKGDQDWRIDTFLLSCRVIGRKVEEAMLAHIVAQARKSGAIRLLGEFTPTTKNEAAKDFYRRSGFEPRDGVWGYDLAKAFPNPDCVKMIEEATK